MIYDYNMLKNIIDTWDPIELLAMHSPPDEYDAETYQIYELLKARSKVSIDFLGNFIYSIFIDSFGMDVFSKSKDECIDIACKIRKSTNTIDIGDNVVASDNNRFVWDFLDWRLMK